MKRIITLLLLAANPWLVNATNVQQLIQLTDYVGVDYAVAVLNGEIINPDEYREMQDFSSAIVEQVAGLPPSDVRQQLAAQAAELVRLIDKRADASEVKALAAAMRQVFISGYDVTVTPRRTPDLEAARALYSEQCAGCHGMSGQGDGPQAALLEPPPTDFTARERYQDRTLLGLYNTITQGLEGTAMQSYVSLNETQRWSLAFYAGQLATTQEEQLTGAAQFKQLEDDHPMGQLEYVATHTPAEVNAVHGEDSVAVMAYLRAHPENFFSASSGTQLLEFSRMKLGESLVAYHAGDKDVAYELAVEAYLEGFELMEGNINAVDPGLGKQVEAAMTGFRNLIRKGAPVATAEAGVQRIEALLATAVTKLDTTALSGSTAFVSALVILLREGLEALLVVAALAAFLIKTKRRDGLVYIYAGIAGAFVLGIATWLAANMFIDISGAQRELTEGFAALFAAVVLFSVGFWMHSKTSAVQWQAFIETSLQRHLGTGTLWGLAGLSFIAVYREMFEVVLFYQALWLQSSPQGQQMIFSGLLVAAGLLLVLGWLILRYSTRLPLRQFFAFSGIFMFVLAFIFTGKGIAALQEAGQIPLDPINIPSVEFLGIFPNMQSTGVQLLLVMVAVVMLYYSDSGKRKTAS
ncbi:MAG: FTR1 family protein [Gammaproteobacteria bacterium]|nr:FTR1 family protein [Gammaproteobacteria bacterium]